MERESLKPHQFFLLVVLFEMGTAVVVALGVEAGQDAWIAILVGMLPAVGLVWLYGFLHRRYPDETLIGYLKRLLGKPIGWLVGFLYIVYFLYIASRVLRDFADLLDASWMKETPLTVELILLFLTIAYVVSLGIDVIAKTGQIFAYLYLFAFLVLVGLLLASGRVDPGNLQPVAEDGRQILKVAFPLVYTFPFGEMIVFTMLFPYVRSTERVTKIAIGAMVFSGLIISGLIAVDISVLGANTVGRAPLGQIPFPLLATTRQINIADFIQRMDVLALFVLIVGGLFKVAILFYAALIGAAELFHIKSHQRLVIPLSIAVVLASRMIADNFPEHLREGLVLVPRYIHLPMQTFLPILLGFLALIRSNQRVKNEASQ